MNDDAIGKLGEIEEIIDKLISQDKHTLAGTLSQLRPQARSLMVYPRLVELHCR